MPKEVVDLTCSDDSSGGEQGSACVPNQGVFRDREIFAEKNNMGQFPASQQTNLEKRRNSSQHVAVPNQNEIVPKVML
jgi:hypothetical protein